MKMDENLQPFDNNEPDSSTRDSEVPSDNEKNIESEDNEPKPEPDNLTVLVEPEPIAKQKPNEDHKECHENIDTNEQDIQQNDTNVDVSYENSTENVKPNDELPPTEQSVEDMLKADEVLNNSFDSLCNEEEPTPVQGINDLQSSLDDESNNTECTRQCTVSLPNIDNLLSQSDVNGRTDVGKIGTSLDPRTQDEQIQIQNDEQASCSNNEDNNEWSLPTEFEEYSEANANKSNLKRCNSSEESITPMKKSKKGITFDSVSVYYFPRTQGFTCIPSQGGSTLGMSWNHSHSRKFSLGEHAAEQRRAHRQFCSQQFSNSRNWNEMSTISSEDSDSDEIISDSEMDYENYNFLQPIPTRERRAMLRASGIHKIDSTEKDECRSIRLSREFCGCTCQVYCDPERCVCAQAGIKCQVDRMNFPCSCTRDGCANENGRIEFNPVRVRTHYIHTLMRLEMEKKKEEEEARNKLILSHMESNPQLAYSPSLELSGNMMNFSYHNELQSYYSQPVSYATSTNSSIVNSCFNFTYAASDQFVIPSASIYHESINSNMRLTTSTPQMEYCCPTNDCLRTDYNGLPKEQDNQNFVIRDLTNGSESSGGNVPYNDSFMQMNDNFTQNTNQQNLDTSVEASEETEKEESDSENFGNIIKKTMVESVIA